MPESRKITDIRLGRKLLYPNSLGDTWDPAWAEDGSLVYPGNDGSGWDKSCSSNLFFNRSSGEDPFNLNSQTTNCMPEYDGWSKRREDGCTWKSSGCVSIDGTLYLGVGRHAYGTESGDAHRRQTARRASIIKSTDHGQTWTRSAEENYQRPMFDRDFTTPYFIHYGQDGHAPAVDGADQFIYAVSNNGFWSNGDHYILGRVERAALPRLDPADWTYYQGGDGLNSESWSHSAASAAPVITNPLKCGESGATYLPAVGRYILVAWHYPGDPNIDSNETHFIYYEAPHPWGPWTIVKEDVIRPEGWYCPRLLSKWQIARGDEIDTILVTGGDYYEQTKYYCFTVAQLSIKTDGKFSPEPVQPGPIPLANTSPAIQYTGSWQFDPSRTGAASSGEFLSQTPGDALRFSFQGTRLKWITSKENNLGIAAVSIDGGQEEMVDLYTFAVVPLYRRQVFTSAPLTPGLHTCTIRATGQKNPVSKGVAITNDRFEIEP